MQMKDCENCTEYEGYTCVCYQIKQRRHLLERDRAQQFDHHATHATERDAIPARHGWLIAAGLLALTALYVLAFVS